MILNNPYTMDQTIHKLGKLLHANNDAIALLEKALDKAKTDNTYSIQLENALLKGSTVECRHVFTVFGGYFERSNTFPWYPHADAINAIDTALYYLKAGFVDSNGKKREVPDLPDDVLLEICAAITEICDDGSNETRALFGVASGRLSPSDLVDDENLSQIFYTVYARDEEGFAKAIHDSDTLEQAHAVARFIKGCNYHLQIEAN